MHDICIKAVNDSRAHRRMKALYTKMFTRELISMVYPAGGGDPNLVGPMPYIGFCCPGVPRGSEPLQPGVV